MTARIRRKRAVLFMNCSFSFCMKLVRKPGKPLSDFPHNALCNCLLRPTVTPYLFTVMECDFHNCFHIKGNGTEQFIPCLLQCRCLNLRHNGGKFLFCYSFRYLLHFCPVFCAVSAVSILCVAPPNIPAVAIFAPRSFRTVVDNHLLSSPYPVAGGFGNGQIRRSEFDYRLPTSFHEI